MQDLIEAKFSIGDIVKHKFLNFRGVIFDLDPVFANTEEWYNAIPKDFRPDKNQPFYHLFAENEEVFYIAYVSEHNFYFFHVFHLTRLLGKPSSAQMD